MDRPVAILSENDFHHALLSLAAQHVGIPCVPVSPAYSLVSSDLLRLRHILKTVSPGLVFAASESRYRRALEVAIAGSAEIVVSETGAHPPPCTQFEELESTSPCPAVEELHSRVAPNHIAKILFTSGSTGQPKGVITTHQMLCCNQQMLAQSLPLMTADPLILVDWLPWHHTFGGSHNFGLVLHNGGTLYLDNGRPVRDGMEETVRNLKGIAPTIYFNVPKGFDGLLPYLRADLQFRAQFFSRLRILFYAAASLSQSTWHELRELARSVGKDPLFLTAIGSTESAPAAAMLTWEVDRPGIIGLPLPGVEAKLVPSGKKMELRLRGPNITPGYFQDRDKTRVAFDEEGFYKTGDAVRLANPQELQEGLEFDGRLAEDFKLSTGTWVNVNGIRSSLLRAAAGLVRDVVVAGCDRDYVSVLIFPEIEVCRSLTPCGRSVDAGAVLCHDSVRNRFQAILNHLASQATGTANRIERAVLLGELPSLDANEVTDKGSINQKAVLERRATFVAKLYEDPPCELVLIASKSAASRI